MGERIKKFKGALLAIQDRDYKLQQDLLSKEDYINYLEKEIIIRDEDLDPLRLEISNLKKQLEKTIQDSINQENYIDYLEKQLAIFQNEIDKLNEKILVLNNNIDMAQLPGSPRLSLPENQATIQNNRIQREINNIRQYFQSPVTITPTINGIVDYLNIISDAGNRFERLVLEIYPRANARAINAENRVANLQTQLITLQTQLINSQTQLADSQTQLATLQNDYDLLHQTYEAHRTQHNIFKSRELDGRITIRTQKRRISELLIESFALKLRNRQTYHQLQNKWGKWKNRARNFEQLINNLNQQVFVLQNNIANMATLQDVMSLLSPLIAQIPIYSTGTS